MSSRIDMELVRQSSPSPPGPRIRRAWIIAAVGFAVMTCAGTFTGMPDLLIDPLHASFGWSRGAISIAVSVNMAVYGLTAPFAAALMDRIGIRPVVAGALAVITAGAAATTVMTSVWQMVLYWGVMVGLGSGAIAMAFGALIAERWFAARRSLVTGILSSATMFGGMVCLPALSELTDNSGWRTATLTVAAVAGAVAVVGYLVLRDRPTDVGVPPYGASGLIAEPEPVPVPGSARRALRVLGEVARPGPFWLVAGTFAICGASTNGVMMSHFVPAAHDHGMPRTAASTLLAVMGVFNVVGTIASGWLTDRFDPRWLLAAYYALRGVTLALLPGLLGPAVDPAVIFFTISFGLLDLATVPPTIALCRDFYGADSTIVFAWVNAVHQLGAGLAALLAGAARDAAGTYTPMWFTVAGLCAFAGVLSAGIRRPRSATGVVTSCAA
ncbi:MFS transporter [Phaeacidiphilus oryzae]|uniref:MFS transporter n=1 Tax=Phaeacidiphilus oryzae TaxID=348818 RepID=UPI00056D0C0B|nr:MFS transporter [Phaeacidiphilus oryzae]